jgi:hypothetical protein
MSTINTSDEEMMALEASYMMLTNKLVDENFSPMACAAIMTKLAMMLYKSTLNPEEYNVMVDTISDSRDLVREFSDYANTGRLN